MINHQNRYEITFLSWLIKESMYPVADLIGINQSSERPTEALSQQ